MVHFLDWMLTEGQKEAPILTYAPLPKKVVEMEKAAIKMIRY